MKTHAQPARTAPERKTYPALCIAGGCIVLCTLAGCPPPPQENVEKQGEFVAMTNRVFDRGDGFDLHDRIVYPETKTEGLVEVKTDITDRALTMARCTWCHECGFKEVFDAERYGKPGWTPLYRGEDWNPVVQRMRVLENSMLNEVLAERIFNFLRDSSTGKYDEAKDRRGGAIRDVPAQSSSGSLTPITPGG
jgi:hypothetical protein